MEETADVKSQPTIGSTTISSKEQGWIRDEVRKIMGQTFPGIQIQKGFNPEMSTVKPKPAIAGQVFSGNEGSQVETIDLVSGS